MPGAVKTEHADRADYFFKCNTKFPLCSPSCSATFFWLNTLKPIFQLVLFCLIILVVPILIGNGLFPKQPFDNKPLEELRERRPDFVFIGNSMLITRLDEARLSELLGGAGVMALTEHGMASAGYWLVFKNYVIESGIRPKVVIIFFRDFDLSWPLYRTTGIYREKLEPFMRKEEPVLEYVWEQSPKNWKDRIGEKLEDIYPIQRRKTEAEDMIREVALDWTDHPWKKDSKLLGEVNDTFQLRELREDVPTELATTEEFSLEKFDPSPQRSFMPHIVEEARKHNITVCFYRVKRRPPRDADFRKESRALTRYMPTLKAWVEEQGMLFYDASRDPAEHLGMYADGDHLDEKYMREWTEIFHKQLQDILK